MRVEERSSTDIGLAFVARPRDCVAAAELDGEAVLFDESTGRLHTLDPIATVVWACLDGTATLRDIAGELAEAYGAERAVVETDVLRLVRQLGDQGVLEGVAADPALVEEPDEEMVTTDDGADC